MFHRLLGIIISAAATKITRPRRKFEPIVFECVLLLLQSVVLLQWSGGEVNRTVTQAAESVKNGDHSRRMAAIRFYLLSRRQFSAHTQNPLTRTHR